MLSQHQRNTAERIAETLVADGWVLAYASESGSRYFERVVADPEGKSQVLRVRLADHYVPETDENPWAGRFWHADIVAPHDADLAVAEVREVVELAIDGWL